MKSMSTSATLLLILASLFCAPGLLFADEFQMWADSDLVLKVLPGLKSKAGAQWRFNDHMDLVHFDAEFGFVHPSKIPWLDAGVFYRQIYKTINGELTLVEKKPYVDVTARFKLSRRPFSNRCRFEFNNLQAFTDGGTFRNKLSVNAPYYLSVERERHWFESSRYKPFASYDFFVDSIDGLSQHRFEGGLSLRVTNYLVLDAAYMRKENYNFDRNAAANIAKVKLKLLF